MCKQARFGIQLFLLLCFLIKACSPAHAEITSPRPIAVFRSGHPENVGINVATDGRLVLVGTGRHSAYLFDPFSQQSLAYFDIGRLGDRVGGTSVAIQGTTAVLGTSEVGASVFDFSDLSAVVHRQLTPSDRAPDNYGLSVDLDGDTIIVGANGDGVESGAAYLFDRLTGEQFGKLVAAESRPTDSFGYSVAIDGSLAAVGATSGVNSFGEETGAVYAFNTDREFAGERLLEKSTGSRVDRWFGFSVDVSDGVAAVAGHGTAYLWSVPDQPTPLAESLVYPESQTNLVSINEDLTAVGFFREELVKLYDRQGNVVARLHSPVAGTSYFGSSVSISGDLLIVGAPLFSGAAYVYRVRDLLVPEPPITATMSSMLLCLITWRSLDIRERLRNGDF